MNKIGGIMSKKSLLEHLLEAMMQEEKTEDHVKSIVNSMVRSWNLNDRARDYILQEAINAKRSKTHYRIAAVFAAAASLCTQELDGIVTLIPIFQPDGTVVMTALCVKTGLQPEHDDEGDLQFSVRTGSVTIH